MQCHSFTFPVPRSLYSRNVLAILYEQSHRSSCRWIQVSDDKKQRVDPLTYEVIRHRLSAITDDMGDTLKRMSGSVVVTDCNDFNAAIADETGNLILVGQYNMQLAASLDMAIKWTLEHRSGSPGLRPGDMFFCNDPWIGGGLHQNDASVFAPLFYDGELFAWSGAVCHQVDLGGVSPGSWSVAGTDVFWEIDAGTPGEDRRRGEICALTSKTCICDVRAYRNSSRWIYEPSWVPTTWPSSG